MEAFNNVFRFFFFFPVHDNLEKQVMKLWVLKSSKIYLNSEFLGIKTG